MELKDETPLQTGYIPEKIINRESVVSKLDAELPGTRNLHLHGPRGTGKTHIVHKELNALGRRTCYISCIEHDTQYQALREILQQLTREAVATGHHTSELQRRLKEQFEALDTTLVLDDLDFLLLNDGNDLLYYLSRLSDGPQIVTISANTQELREMLEPRTYSSLQPLQIQLEPYTGEEVYEILADRASKSLKPRSLHRNALTYIASKTQNTEIALIWLKEAAQKAEQAITEQTVQDTEEEALGAYVERRLEKLTQHHRQIYQIIEKESGQDSVINTGELYRRYQEVSQEQGLETVSNRRISDYLKQLEQLNLIESEYHYGGEKGKTRDIRICSEISG